MVIERTEQFLRLDNTSPTVTGNGKVLSLDANGNVILVDDGGSSTAGWSLTGNSGTTAGTNFLSTTDNEDLVFKTNNTELFRLTAAGNFLIGTATDNGKKLQVVGSSHELSLAPESERSGWMTTARIRGTAWSICLVVRSRAFSTPSSPGLTRGSDVVVRIDR